MEKITIRNFAGIDKLDLDIKPINILIGPQGVGKSVVVKLVYLFKKVLEDIFSARIESYEEKEVKDLIFNDFKRIFDKSVWENKADFEIVYTDKQALSFKIKSSSISDFTIEFSTQLKEILSDLTKFQVELEQTKIETISEKGVRHWLDQKIDLHNEITKFLREKYGQERIEQIFIPAGRSFFTTVDKNIYSIIDSRGKYDTSLDFFLVHFGTIYQMLSGYDILSFKENENTLEGKRINELIETILGGKIIEGKEGIEFLLHKDQRKVAIKHTSSGQQEALPLVLLIKALYNNVFWDEDYTLFIEEPEAHLFPTAQKAIVELLAKVHNKNLGHSQLFITTHSPYILTSFNNLIYAGNLIKEDESRRTAVEEIIDPDAILDSSLFSAYALQKSGATDLMDEENGIINAELLDEVSNTIGKQFDQLLDIEYVGQD
ncbi:AAA family ATPase [Myroides sp. 1354]|uniref:AAA family ATPase n=1 Tax=unclassified Myroides TaxID=2642485 RepID=UPI002575C449|nr:MULTISPECIES: ATP-binding protein [unclassified Myroides]MDM1043702.1 AAA family ATPase [Myroides sp. R163-1]MDM1054248.1 AAA family ATPase [Myroides sp. 1354]MDM1067544.1 AAA family ATPase [Myroides sp. 1372]